MGDSNKRRTYRVNQKLVGAGIVGGVLQRGRIITRTDLPAASDDKWNHLIKDGWIEEVKDGSKIQTK